MLHLMHHSPSIILQHLQNSANTQHSWTANQTPQFLNLALTAKHWGQNIPTHNMPSQNQMVLLLLLQQVSGIDITCNFDPRDHASMHPDTISISSHGKC